MVNSTEPVSGRAAAPGQNDALFGPSSCALRPPPYASERGHSLGIEELGLRHLKTLPEIATILHLREAIDLSVHSAASSDFLAREKKETSAASSARSSCAGKP